jgi:hypothetical protein
MRIIALIESVLLISVLVLGAPPIGGSCAYSTYVGQAVITRIAPVGGSSSAYDAFFRFTTRQTIAEDWAQGEGGKENPLSMASGIDGKLSELHIKPGNSYGCTLSVITSGACTPLIYALKPPSSSDGIDTSSIWFWPDTVKAGKPFVLNLISEYFDCNTIFSNTSVTCGNVRIDLWYHADQNPLAGVCLPSAQLYGIPFTIDALPAGTFPIYSAQVPACYPLCEIAIMPVFTGWLTAREAAGAHDAGIRKQPDQPAILSINTTRGRVEAIVTTRVAAAISMEILTPKGEVLGRCAGSAERPGTHRLCCDVKPAMAGRRGPSMLLARVTANGRALTAHIYPNQ